MYHRTGGSPAFKIQNFIRTNFLQLTFVGIASLLVMLSICLRPFLGQKKGDTNRHTYPACVSLVPYVKPFIYSLMYLARTAKKMIVKRNMNIIPISVRVNDQFY